MGAIHPPAQMTVDPGGQGGHSGVSIRARRFSGLQSFQNPVLPGSDGNFGFRSRGTNRNEKNQSENERKNSVRQKSVERPNERKRTAFKHRCRRRLKQESV